MQRALQILVVLINGVELLGLWNNGFLDGVYFCSYNHDLYF